MEAAAQPRKFILRPDLCIRPFDSEGTSYSIEDPLRNTFYRIGEREYRFLCMLSSGNAAGAIADGADQGEDTLSKEEAAVILKWLEGNQLLQDNDLGRMRELEQAALKMKKRKMLGRLNLIVFKVPLFNPDPLLDRITPWLRTFTGPWFFLFWLASAFSAVGCFIANGEAFFKQGSVIFSAQNLIILSTVWIGLKLLHELSHALACRRYGGNVYEMGILFILFIPLTYVNVSSSWSFPSRWQRIHVAVAGIYSELFIASLAMIYWSSHQGTASGMIAFNTVIVAGVSSLIFNANPLMRFDGYYILSDLVNIPNLYSQGMRTVVRSFKSWWTGAKQPGPGKHSFFLTFYGVAIFLWRIIALSTMTYVAYMMFKGWGVFIAAIAAITWLTPLVTLFIRSIKGISKEKPATRRHMMKRTLMLVLLSGLVLFGIQWHRTMRIPGVILFDEQYSIHAPVEGFIENIAVREGEKVAAGTALLQLSNRELDSDAKTLALKKEEAEIKRRIANAKGDIVSTKLLTEQIRLISEQLDMASTDIASMQITAPGNGMVVAKNLRNRKGVWVEKGTELLQVVDTNDKHLIAMIDQNLIGSILSSDQHQLSIDMDFAGKGRVPAKVKRFSPSASTKLVHLSLAAPFGGPLDVRVVSRSSGSQYELFDPHFTVTVVIPPALLDDLKNGQQIDVLIEGDKHSLGHYLYSTLQRWYRKHLKRRVEQHT